MSRHWVKITRGFAIREKQTMYVHLECFDPDFTTVGQGGPVDLRIGSEMIRMRHIGAGNIESELVLVLIPQDARYRTVEEIRAKMGDVGDVFVARVLEGDSSLEERSRQPGS